jgi:hypothetical protein
MDKEHADESRSKKTLKSLNPSKLDEKDADSQPSAYNFHPIKISGEALSAVIIRERRERPW